jgi:CBS domain-containing protein
MVHLTDLPSVLMTGFTYGQLTVVNAFPGIRWKMCQSNVSSVNVMECAMKVRDAMHKKVEWAQPTDTVQNLARRMREYDIGAIPIGENDRLIGMVTDRDIAVRAVANGRDSSALTARDVMTKGIVYCRDDEDLEDAVRIMEQKQIRRLPVIDDKKRMVGMLSLGDISHAASRQLTGEVVAAVSEHH